MRGRGKGNDGLGKKGRPRSPLVQHTGVDAPEAEIVPVENPAGNLGSVHIGRRPISPKKTSGEAGEEPKLVPEKKLPEFKAPTPEETEQALEPVKAVSNTANPFAKRKRQVLSAYDESLPLEDNVQRPGFDLAFAEVLNDKGVIGWNEFVNQLTIDRARSGSWLGPNISGFTFTKIPDEVWAEARDNNLQINLRGANIDGADLRGLTPEQLNLLDLSRAYWHQTKLDDLDLREWKSLDNQTFDNCSFKNANFAGRHWKLSNDEMSGNDLTNADLTGTTVEAGNMAKLIDWTFDGAKLNNATLQGFTIEKGSFKNVKALETTWETEILNCNFSDCDLSRGISNAEQDYKVQPYWWEGNKITRCRMDHFQAGALLWHSNHFVDTSIRGLSSGWANLTPESRSQTMNGTSGNWLTNNTFENSVLTFDPQSFKILPYKGPVVVAHNKLLGTGCAFGGENVTEFKGWSFWSNDWTAGRLQNATFLDCKWGEPDKVIDVSNVTIAPDCKMDKGALKDNNTGTILPVGERINPGKVTSKQVTGIPEEEVKKSFWKRLFT